MRHTLECENCGGNVDFRTKSTRGAAGMLAGGIFGAVVGGPVGALFGGLGGARMTGGGGGKCEQCGAVYGRDAINLMREKPSFKLPANRPQPAPTAPQSVGGGGRVVDAQFIAELRAETRARAAAAAAARKKSWW